MRYVVTQNQTTNISGSINLPDSENGSFFNGIYNNEAVVLTEDFLKFEHIDGLNYVNIEIGRIDDVSKVFGIQNTDKFQINLTEGLSEGVPYPKTNATVLGKKT